MQSLAAATSVQRSSQPLTEGVTRSVSHGEKSPRATIRSTSGTRNPSSRPFRSVRCSFSLRVTVPRRNRLERRSMYTAPSTTPDAASTA
jgi:hypothetical protein